MLGANLNVKHKKNRNPKEVRREEPQAHPCMPVMMTGGREMFEIPYGMSSLKQKSKQKVETEASGVATEEQHQQMSGDILNNCGAPALGPPSTAAPLALPSSSTLSAIASGVPSSSQSQQQEEMDEDVWKVLSLTVPECLNIARSTHDLNNNAEFLP